MTTIREFFPQIRALFSNFWKRTGETSPLPPLVTRLIEYFKDTFKQDVWNRLFKQKHSSWNQVLQTGHFVFLIYFLYNAHNNFLQLEIHYVHNWTHLMPLVSFDTPWKHQKTIGFLMFSWIIKRDQWHKID